MNPQEPTLLQHKRNLSLRIDRNRFDDRSIKRVNTCHNQLNQTGLSGTSWRLRNNYIHTNAGFKPKAKIFRPTCSKQLKKTLFMRGTGSDMTKSMINTLKSQVSVIDKTPKLVKGMTSLKEMNLLISKDLTNVRYIQRKNRGILSDYHVRKTNGGFGRSHCGRLYTS